MRRRFSPTVAAALTALAVLVVATPASADDVRARCKTTGAVGGVTVYDFSGATDHVRLFIGVTDTKADRHHVRVRFLSKDVNGKTKRWPWRINTRGAGKSREWRTTATNDSGIFSVGLQVARFEGGTILNSCVDWA